MFVKHMKNEFQLDYNFHTHTPRCGHAIGREEEYIENALKANFKYLGFSDHTYINNFSQPFVRMDKNAFPEYIVTLNQLKKKYSDKIEILIGLECEYCSNMVEEYKWLLQENILDYLIIGQHFIFDDNGCHSFDSYSSSTSFNLYVRELLKGIDTGLFSCVAHPDLFTFFYQEDDDSMKKNCELIIDKVIEKDVVLELNISKLANNIRSGKNMFYSRTFPHDYFWKIAGEKKAKVMVGLDAHTPLAILDSLITGRSCGVAYSLMVSKFVLFNILDNFVEEIAPACIASHSLGVI